MEERLGLVREAQLYRFFFDAIAGSERNGARGHAERYRGGDDGGERARQFLALVAIQAGI
jgi:hypothetical protein